MAKKVYGFEIHQDKIALFEQILQKEPSIEKFFGKEWIRKYILDFYKDRTKIHPLFWIIIGDKDFVKKLPVLEKSYDKFKGLIDNLKTDIINIHNIISNINVYYEYKLKHSTVFFEPKNVITNKKCDVKVIIEGVEYWGEVLTINEEKGEKSHDTFDNDIKILYDENNRTNNGIIIEYERFLTLGLKDKLINFLLQESKKLNLAKGEEVAKKFIVNSELICTIAFFGKGTVFEKGYYGGSAAPVHLVEDDRRIKNKILDKLDKFQFPNDVNIRKFLVLILKGYADIIDVDDAIQGQECIIVNNKDQSYKESRNQDGIVHDLARSKLLNEIDFIVVNENDVKHHRRNSKSSLSLEFIKSNF